MTSGLLPFSPTEMRARLKLHRQIGETHYLYRCYDADGRLLYIGCSQNPRRRIELHGYSKSAASLLLQEHMARHEVDPTELVGSVAALSAERAAILAEQPLFNIQHKGVPTWTVRREIKRYESERASS